MFKPIKVVDVELTALAPIENVDGYQSVYALVRLHGSPIGWVTLRPRDGRCAADYISAAILEQHAQAIIDHLTADALAAPESEALTSADLARAAHPAHRGPTPVVTVAVCTRDRTEHLRRCLTAIVKLRYPALEVLVVDNAPATDATERLVREEFPSVRYVLEPTPGLDWARNRAIAEARGEIVAFADDDVVVDSGWASALADVFAENPEVMAVTGLVVPYELETEAQVLFEFRYGGWGRGFQRRWHSVPRNQPALAGKWYAGAGIFGTGANMAYRRSLFAEIGGFDPGLDVGTVTNGGGDLDMFFRVVEAGHTLVYEPAAIVRHCHRREYAQLRTQLRNHGIGLYAYLFRSFLCHPRQRMAFARLGLWWFWFWSIRRLIISIFNPSFLPRDLVVAELWGSGLGPLRYLQARRRARALGGTATPNVVEHGAVNAAADSRHGSSSGGVRTVEASRPLEALDDVGAHDHVRVFVTWHGRLLGNADIANHEHPVSATRLRDAVAAQVNAALIQPQDEVSSTWRWANARALLTRRFSATDAEAPAKTLDERVSVSIVIATHDRADDLRRCLRSVLRLQPQRPLEVIVVDNNPGSGVTPPVLAEFPGVVLLNEPRHGAAYARNKGFLSCRGEIVVSIDDDVEVPAGWLEKLIAPFARPDVAAVTGNILPLELETEAQRLFEFYGGLGRGYAGLEVDGHWFSHYRFRAVPTWILGGTANVAYRASVFSDAEVGLLDERLGPGTPTGVGEDSYHLYRVIAAGHTIVYEPAAYLYHRHRRDMEALRRQIYNYSKGHVAHHLTTLFRDHDLRAVTRLVIELPWAHLWRAQARVRRRSQYPLSLLMVEVLGNLAGPWCLWRSHRRVKRDGRSAPHLPVAARATAAPHGLVDDKSAAAVESRLAS